MSYFSTFFGGYYKLIISNHLITCYNLFAYNAPESSSGSFLSQHFWSVMSSYCRIYVHSVFFNAHLTKKKVFMFLFPGIYAHFRGEYA